MTGMYERTYEDLRSSAVTEVTRMPLYNMEAEQGLLAAIMVDNGCFFDSWEICQPEDFYTPVHGEIFSKCFELIGNGVVAGPITLKHSFENNMELEGVGGAAYLAELVGNVVSIHNVCHYSNIISDLAQRRNMISLLDGMRGKLLESDEPVGDIRADLSSALEDSIGASNFVKTKREVALSVIEAIQLPAVCYPTGLNHLDTSMSGGLYAGFTYGLAGVEKRGKTTFCHTISSNLNDMGVPHAYIALEMGATQIEQRNIARSLGVNSMKFLKKETRDDLDFLRRVSDSALNCKDFTFYLDMPGCTFDQIRAEISRLVAKKKIKGFILDYWQLVGGCPPRQSKADFLYDVAQWCANFSRKHKIWCILPAQVNREGTVFGSAGLEKACDQLYFIELAESQYSEDAQIYLKMTHSRYTPLGDIGGEHNPKFYINKESGPYVAELP